MFRSVLYLRASAFDVGPTWWQININICAGENEIQESFQRSHSGNSMILWICKKIKNFETNTKNLIKWKIISVQLIDRFVT